MGEFFKPWRRKLGVLTVGLACVFMIASIRSFSQPEWLPLPFGFDSQSIDGELIIGGYRSGHSVEIFGVYFSDVPPGGRTFTIPYQSFSIPLILVSAWLLLSKQPAQRPIEPPKDQP